MNFQIRNSKHDLEDASIIKVQSLDSSNIRVSSSLTLLIYNSRKDQILYNYIGIDQVLQFFHVFFFIVEAY